jgi:hypothetical protein
LGPGLIGAALNNLTIFAQEIDTNPDRGCQIFLFLMIWRILGDGLNKEPDSGANPWSGSLAASNIMFLLGYD